MAHIKYLLVSLLLLLFSACGGHADSERSSSSKGASSKEEVYDYRDERYQDFYSRYMRKTGKDYLILKPQDVQKKLEIENIPDNFSARMDVFRLNAEVAGKVPMNYFIDSKDVKNYYDNKIKLGEMSNTFEYKECEGSDRVQGLYCIREDYPHFMYFYFPKGDYKLININHSINFSCNREMRGEKQCKLLIYPGGIYNMRIYIHFTNPENFFYIMPFIEKHFYEITGEHIWQNLPKQ